MIHFRPDTHRNSQPHRCSGTRRAIGALFLALLIMAGFTSSGDLSSISKAGGDMERENVNQMLGESNPTEDSDRDLLIALFISYVHELEDLVARPIDNETKIILRREIDLLLKYIDINNPDVDIAYLNLLERRLGRLRSQRAGVFDANPKDYEAMINRLDQEENQIVDEIRRLKDRLERK